MECKNCGNTDNFEECNIYYDDVGIIEYSIRCMECGEIIGYWSYGRFFMYDED